MAPLMDVLLPMVPVSLLGQFELLVIVVVAEFAVVQGLVRGSLGRTLVSVEVANVATTVVGYPIGWCFMSCVRWLTGATFFGSSVFQFPWDHLSTSIWSSDAVRHSLTPSSLRLYYLAAASLVIVSFLLSVLIETWICLRLMGGDKALIRRAVWRANLVSYLQILVATVALTWEEMI